MLDKIYQDEEMYLHFLTNVADTSTQLFDADNNLLGCFGSFGTKYIGRLDNPGVVPGLYLNRQDLILDSGDILNSKNCFLSPTEAEERLRSLPESWQFIDYSNDFIKELPNTSHIEGDIVRIIDENHDQYSDDLGINQYTVYRIDYESAVNADKQTIYKLRAGSLIFTADESQIKAATHGLSPIRILESGQTLRFRSLKDEAEFYLLIGQYTRVFNPITFNYKWDVNSAQQMVALTKAHGLLKKENYFWLINFLDDELGRQVAAAGIILEP